MEAIGESVAQVPAFFSQPFAAGLNADALYQNWYNFKFENEIDKAIDAQGIASVLAGYGSSFILLSEVWGTAEKRKIIEDASDEIAKIGSISVRSLSDKYRFDTELLENSELTGGQGWSLMQGAPAATEESFLVTVSAPLFQTVKIRGGIRYMNEVTARCGSIPGQGRVQINWLDEKMQFISWSAKVYDCTADWQVHRQTVAAPRNAVFATVYGTSHTATPIEITRISLR